MFKKCMLVFFLAYFFCFTVKAEMIVQTGIMETEATAETEYLDPSIRHVDPNIIDAWFNDWGIGQVETRMQFIIALWKLHGSPQEGIALGNAEEIETEHASVWASNTGIPVEGDYTVDSVDSILWTLAGSQNSSQIHDLPEDITQPWILWACDAGIHIAEEEQELDASAIPKRECLYYFYHRRAERDFPITVHEFLQSCQNVVDTARENHYKYGNSKAENPTTDGIISCDRMVAKALYDLGYIDQPKGGITCGNADKYLSSWGFSRSESLEDAKKGSILLVKHKGKETTSHMFVFANDFNMQTMTGMRYDCGQQENIDAIQPIELGFWYRTDSLVVFNIP